MRYFQSNLQNHGETRLRRTIICALALMASAQLAGCKRQTDCGSAPPPPPPPPGTGTLVPLYIHRGAVTLFTIGADTATEAATNSQLSVSSATGAPGSCSNNSTVIAVNAALASFTDPDTGTTISEQVNCGTSYFVTNVKESAQNGYNETYFAFKTIPKGTTNPPSPANGYAIYYAASGAKPAELLFQPQ
jgi:hypothetical protein